MLFLTTYRTKPFLSKGEQKELLDLFAQHGAAPGTIAHYVSADNSTGWAITEAEDASGGFATVVKYEQYIEFETKPVLAIDDALPHMMEAAG
ncbi:MAG: DUF3303 family protein [Acidimicrobiales bacterium]|jgi:hypothetical protein